MRLFILVLVLLLATPSHAFFGQKSAYEKEVKERKKIRVKREKELAERQANKGLNQNLTLDGQVGLEEERNEQRTIKLEENDERDQHTKEKKSRTESKQNSEKVSEIEKIRQELKANEEKALNFVFPSIDSAAEEITRENFFSKTEKEQLLELWRATLARNRTIQFIIKALSANPDDYEKNNAVMQLLARAMFVPFYAVTAIADNALLAGGSAVGARVIGDVVGDHNEKRDRSREITRTDMMVLFMLTDEVAERLRNAYYAYKEAKIEKELIKFELETARLDLAEAYDREYDSSIFFTRMVVRDMERRTRENALNYRNNRRTLIELAGEDSVDSVDLLLDLEVEEILGNIIGV
jgi:hypothetical protein